jgi:iron complex transport system substrate-binding protein
VTQPILSRRLALAGGACAFAGRAFGATRPQRIVSLVSCLDAILVEVADPGQIAALSRESRDPNASTIAAVARRYPGVRETAEEILVHRPDLVLGSIYTPHTLRAALKRLRIRVEIFDLPKTPAQSLAQVRQVAAAAGHANRGEALVRRIEAALAAARPAPGSRPVDALIFQPNGFTTGPGNLMNAMLTACGFRNAAIRYGLKQSGRVPLEQLIADPPQVLLAGETAPGAATWAERVVTHPALRSLDGRMQRATFPMRLFYCGGPVLIETAAALARARRGYEART